MAFSDMIRFSDQLGTVRLIIGLNDLEDLFQPNLFYYMLSNILTVIMCAVLPSVLAVNMGAA